MLNHDITIYVTIYVIICHYMSLTFETSSNIETLKTPSSILRFQVGSSWKGERCAEA
jgi:hypothetical protein